MSKSRSAGAFKLAHTAGVAVSDDKILSDMRRVASDRGHGRLPSRLYQSQGKYSVTAASKRFGSWNAALKAAGLQQLNEVNIPDEDLHRNIGKVWVSLGRQPRRREMLQPLSAYSERPYTRRFGSWRLALEAFIRWAETSGGSDIDPADSVARKRRTPRDPNLALRWRVMNRDSFRCKNCGRSPATSRSVELHVDHIRPWSEGGETTLENLQTLCSKCNLGKGTQHQKSDIK